jgi:hypothetical protein
MKLSCLKALIPGLNSKGQTTIWPRELVVYKALCEILPEKDNPAIIGGRYSWLPSQATGYPMQIDILYTKITNLAGQEFSVPYTLAIEVQSNLHDGKWNKSKQFFFKTKEEFDHYTKNQVFKARQLRKRGVPLLEIDPSKDSLDKDLLVEKIKKVLGVR